MYLNKVIYKDDEPINTINRIRSILNKYGLFTIEKMWNKFANIFCCRVVIAGTNVGTNGKGLTEELALASAYGEFMERLSNQVLFAQMEVSALDFINGNIIFDNKEITENDMKNYQCPEIFKNAYAITEEDGSIYDIWELSKKDLKKGERHPFLPFYNLKNKKVEHLPFILVRAYGSNGMAAGNTPEEAITQALAEIFERYVIREVYFKKLALPTLSKKQLEKYFPNELSLIQKIESEGHYKVIVKDATLGKNLPVMCAILYDLDKNTYLINFGAEPTLEFALSRCLTELFQGKKEVSEKILNFSPKLNMDNTFKFHENDDYHNIVTVGSGRWPAEFFLGKPNYSELSSYKKINFNSMKEKMNYSLKIIQDLGFTIYIRDSSFLGFPAFNIIVPGMSEPLRYSKKERERKLGPFSSKTYNLSNLKKASDELLINLAEDIEKFSAINVIKVNNLLEQYFDIPIENNPEWQKCTVEFLLAIIYYKLGNYEKAYKNMNIFIDFVSQTNPDLDISYHRCISNYFAILTNEKSMSENEIRSVLSNFYESDLISTVLEDLKDKNNLFKYIPLPNNFNCTNCDLKPYCKYELIIDIHKKTLEAIKENQIFQKDIEKLIL